MNIKEIIDAERWVGGYDSNYNHVDGNTAEVFYSDHNTSIARIEKAVMKYIAELEEALDVRDMQLSDISKACESAGCLDDEAMDDFIFKQAELIAELEVTTIIDGDIIKNLKQRIAELEAQLPKVVKPRPSKDGYYECDCANDEGDGWLYRTDTYCYRCGARLDWI